MPSTVWLATVAVLLPSVAALDNGLARTPPMGFSTWSVFRSAGDHDDFLFFHWRGTVPLIYDPSDVDTLPPAGKRRTPRSHVPF